MATVIVVDASVLAPALADDGRSGDAARSRLAPERLTAPELIDLEVGSTLRGLTLARKLPVRRAELALRDLEDLPLERVPHRLLVGRCWDLRGNLSFYDAAYVALAELLGARLLTADVRIGRASGVRCEIEILAD